MSKLWIFMVIAAAVLIVTATIISLTAKFGAQNNTNPSNDVHTPRRLGKNWTDSINPDHEYHVVESNVTKYTVNTEKTNSKNLSNDAHTPTPFRENVTESINPDNEYYVTADNNTKYTVKTDGTVSYEGKEVKNWPKIFVLSTDPNFPVVCYSGITVNVKDNNANETEKSNQEDISSSKPKGASNLFILSDDPMFPVVCQKGNILPDLLQDGTGEEVNKDMNVTCIRRDYEGNVSAVFLHKTGPLDMAWNIFNSSIPYGYWNVENVDSIDETKILGETIVDCDGFSFEIGDKAYKISLDAARSIAG